MGIYNEGLEPNLANRVSLSPVSFLERSALAFPSKIAVIDGSRTARAPVPSQRRRRIPSGGAADKKRSASIKP